MKDLHALNESITELEIKMEKMQDNIASLNQMILTQTKMNNNFIKLINELNSEISSIRYLNGSDKIPNTMQQQMHDIWFNEPAILSDADIISMIKPSFIDPTNETE